MLQDFIIIGQSSIPISTAAPTHYVRFYTHIFEIYFSKIFRALFLAPGTIALHFRIPLLTLLIPIFFPNFRPYLHFLLQGIHLLTINILYTSPLRLWRGIPTYNITPTQCLRHTFTFTAVAKGRVMPG